MYKVLNMLVNQIEYKEIDGTDRARQPKYKEAVIIDKCRVDYAMVYNKTTNDKTLVANAIVFCYRDLTTPFIDFKEQSLIVVEGREHVIQKVIPIQSPFLKEKIAYELEVL